MRQVNPDDFFSGALDGAPFGATVDALGDAIAAADAAGEALERVLDGAQEVSELDEFIAELADRNPFIDDAVAPGVLFQPFSVVDVDDERRFVARLVIDPFLFRCGHVAVCALETTGRGTDGSEGAKNAAEGRLWRDAGDEEWRVCPACRKEGRR